MRVVLAGGGTAGHIEPALNLADELRRRDPTIDILALGTSRGLEVSLVPARGYALRLIPPVPLPRRIDAALLTLPARLRASVREAGRAIDGADVVVGFGGYVALPAYLAARGKVPIVVHEANAKPGLANRIGARLATAVAESVAGSLPGARLTGNPLRSAIAQLDRAAMRHQARDYFGLPQHAYVVLVFGGSQGAGRINAALRDALPRMSGVAVLHAYGSRNEPVAPATDRYVPVPFIDRMDLAYAAADLAVCRSGAMTVAEVSAVGLPSIFVPLPIGNGEQSLNAASLVAAGAALQVPDGQFTASTLVDTVMPLAANEPELRRMSAAARGFGRRNAASLLADLVMEVIAR